jgi:hypothetical protein
MAWSGVLGNLPRPHNCGDDILLAALFQQNLIDKLFIGAQTAKISIQHHRSSPFARDGALVDLWPPPKAP